jgi:hypothetical protein
MPRFRKGALEHSAADDLWKHTLSQIPTLYGRIAYLASLRDQNSGAYRHHGLAVLFGRDESSRALRESHEDVFVEWIRLSMREKRMDVARHFATLEDPVSVVAEHMLASRIYHTQIPAAAERLEQELFCTDLKTVLETIRSGLEESGPTSSPRVSPVPESRSPRDT